MPEKVSDPSVKIKTSCRNWRKMNTKLPQNEHKFTTKWTSSYHKMNNKLPQN